MTDHAIERTSCKRTNIIDEIASQIARIDSCDRSLAINHNERAQANRDNARDILEAIEHWLPSGSGVDNGSTIDRDASTPVKIVIQTAYHHMNENGYYDGWTEHKITVTPTFSSFDIRVSGSNRNEIKDYLADCFMSALSTAIDVWNDGSVTIGK